MDAFAVAVCAGLTMKKVTLKNALIVGLYFGIFQAAMPLIGYYVATWFADKIIAYDHWIAFALLCFLGVKMIVESLRKDKDTETGNDDIGKDTKNRTDNNRDVKSNSDKNRSDNTFSLGPVKMLPLAVATSIDALAAGVSFAFLRVSIIPAVSFIGLTTMVISMAGVKIGNIFGIKFKAGAEIAGGVILILIGIKILVEHLVS